ncbi:hypothetical protein [Naasia lichenicola]|uniref:Uncharacterized protein n=1 Tax=Naasia lichenicola TaxID=2565933 RepID=A0A4S4FEP6_9MICO|nr:hypothetical protein [Naasia lichenicola]THG28630.1 hypothetical protein E6C64_17690 [Naasia lichenicola]
MTVSGLPLLRTSPYRRQISSIDTPLVSWEHHGRMWLGSIHGQIAGTVTRQGLMFRAVDWVGEVAGTFLSLGAAQRALEPGRIAERRDSVYDTSTRREAALAAIVGSSVVTVGLAAGVLLVRLPL